MYDFLIKDQETLNKLYIEQKELQEQLGNATPEEQISIYERINIFIKNSDLLPVFIFLN